MNMKRTLASIALAGLVATTAAPAYADGAASTRNIIGGAALAAGALILINHNKQVHAREAQMAQNQAAAEESAANYQASYASERKAYLAQVALNNEYKHEVAVQHNMIVQLRGQVAAAKRSTVTTGYNQPAQPARVATTSYGWGTL